MKSTTLALAVAAGLALSGPALAQDTDIPDADVPMEMDTPPEMETLPAPDGLSFTDEQIQVFAVAFLEVQSIGQGYDAALQEAATAEEQQQLQMQAMDEMVLAVEQVEGITVEEYNAIFQAAQTDPELAQQLQAEIDQIVQAQ